MKLALRCRLQVPLPIPGNQGMQLSQPQAAEHDSVAVVISAPLTAVHILVLT